MPAADDDLPIVIADRTRQPVVEAPIGLRQRGNRASEHAETFAIGVELLVVVPGRPVERDAAWRRAAPGIRGQQSAQHVFLARHPEVDAEAPGQPAGTTDVIGMQVGDDDMRQR